MADPQIQRLPNQIERYPRVKNRVPRYHQPDIWQKSSVHVNIDFDSVKLFKYHITEYFEMLRQRKRIFFTHESGLSMIRVNWQILGEQVVKKHCYIVAGS